MTLMPGKKNKAATPALISLSDPSDPSGALLFTDNTKMANFANLFFTNIGPQLASKIVVDNSNYIDNLPQYIHAGEPLLSFDPVTEFELLRLVKKMDTNKASNVPNIASKYFKHCMLCSLPQLTHLYNFVLYSSLIPQFWKSAAVIPIHKSGIPTLITNYRPISLLPQIVKTFEKIIHERLYSFANLNGIITKEQGGFLPKLGTNDTIGKLLGDVYTNINRGEPTLCIFFDLKKAFDTIDHTILLTKLKYMGLQDSALSLLTNYLSNRLQATIINSTTSSNSTMSCGVPQGSTLGPLLFILYINDLPNYIKEVNVKLYADDTVFYINAANIEKANTTMSLAAAKFSEWCSYNKLTINASKSKCMLFSSKLPKIHSELKKHINIRIGNVSLETVSEYKYLGILLDERLLFVKHVNYIISTISNRLLL